MNRMDADTRKTPYGFDHKGDLQGGDIDIIQLIQAIGMVPHMRVEPGEYFTEF